MQPRPSPQWPAPFFLITTSLSAQQTESGVTIISTDKLSIGSDKKMALTGNVSIAAQQLQVTKADKILVDRPKK